MRKRVYILSSMFVVIGLLVNTSLFAAYEDSNNGIYKFESTMVAFSVSYDNGNTWYTVFDYTSQYEANPNDSSIPKVDVAASDDPGAQLGTFVSGKTIPAGTITHFKPKFPNGTDIFKGWKKRTSDNKIFYSTASGFSEWISPMQITESDCADYTLPAGPDFGNYMEDSVAVSGGGIVVTEGATINISIQFDLSTAFEVQDDGEISPSDSFIPTITQI